MCASNHPTDSTFNLSQSTLDERILWRICASQKSVSSSMVLFLYSTQDKKCNIYMLRAKLRCGKSQDCTAQTSNLCFVQQSQDCRNNLRIVHKLCKAEIMDNPRTAQDKPRIFNKHQLVSYTSRSTLDG